MASEEFVVLGPQESTYARHGVEVKIGMRVIRGVRVRGVLLSGLVCLVWERCIHRKFARG
jgi:uncharacterized membrane protein